MNEIGKNLVTITLPFPGVLSYLRNLSKVVGSTCLVLGEDQIALSKDQITLFGAWHPIYRTIIDRIPNKKGVLWTSSGGEMDFTPNSVEVLYLNEIHKLLDEGIIDFILFTDPHLAEAFEGDKTLYIPCPVEILPPPQNKEKIDGISFFQPAKITKNIYNNLLAVKLVQKELSLKLYTNLKPYEEVIKGLGIDYEMYDWLPREEYFDLISRMKVNLAAFWCGEYFNYQVTESALLGTESVVSKNADYYPLNYSKVQNLDDPVEIARKIKQVCGHQFINIRLVMIQRCDGWNAQTIEVLDEVQNMF
jgi:hypothetical protein